MEAGLGPPLAHTASPHRPVQAWGAAVLSHVLTLSSSPFSLTCGALGVRLLPVSKVGTAGEDVVLVWPGPLAPLQPRGGRCQELLREDPAPLEFPSF